MKKVAVVTGSNKGIGLAIVKGLCKSFDGDVYLTARDESRGKAAVASLEAEGLKPCFHQLDISDSGSVAALKGFLQQTYQGLDLLVNNAAVLFYDDHPSPLAEQVSQTMQINYFDQLTVCQELFPLLRPHARVVNVSSGAGAAIYRALPAATAELFDKPDISLEELNKLMMRYKEAGQAGTLDQSEFFMEQPKMLDGLPPVRSSNGMGVYGYSKLGLNILTRLQQATLDQQGSQDVIVNACTPGYVNTDMTHGNGTLSPEEGAVTPLYCCLLPPSNPANPRGEFIRNKAPEHWQKR